MDCLRNIHKLTNESKKFSQCGSLVKARDTLTSKVLPLIDAANALRHQIPSDIQIFLDETELAIRKNLCQRSDEGGDSPPKRIRVVSPDKTCKKDLDPTLDKFSRERDSLVKSMLVRSDAKYSLDDAIVGLKRAKEALREAVVEPLMFPHWFTNGCRPWRCILLFGPPGTGKSQLAHALSAEIPSSHIYHVSSADVVSTWMGQSEQLIRDLFTKAVNSGKPSLIFFDEIDSLCRTRSCNEEESTRRIKTQLLIQIQRILDESSTVFMLGATNCPWDIDSAFLRRFQKRIYIGLPDKPSRIEMVRRFLRGVNFHEPDWSVIGDKTEGLSGNDLNVLAQEILHQPLRELRTARQWTKNLDGSWTPFVSLSMEKVSAACLQTLAKCSFDEMSARGKKLNPRPVCLDDVLQALAECQRTVTNDDVKRFEDFSKKFGLIG